MADGKRRDPERSYKFRLIVPGFDGSLGFKKVSGLNIKNAVIEYREGTDTRTVRKLPGLAEFDPITCERGVSDSVALINFMNDVVNLQNEDGLPPDDEFRREVTIQVLSHRNEVVRTYIATACFPSELNLADLDAMANDVLIETLVLVHEGLRVDQAQSDIGLQS